jgi:hypothetical protein
MKDITMFKTTLATLGAGWLGTIGTWVTHTDTALHLASGVLAIAGSSLAIVAAIYVIRSKRQEFRASQAHAAIELGKLCAECRLGNPPPECPIPKVLRPKACPHPEL